MSKTKGNVLDPADLVEEYGADAVRFTLASLDSPGRDIPLNPEQMAGYRAFGNKIWNAARFALSRVGEARGRGGRWITAGLAAPERWILSRLSRTAAEVDEQLETFRFDEACRRLYHFFWGDLCDWYIELAKPALAGEAPRPAGGRGAALGARPEPPAAPSGHAVPDRGGLAAAAGARAHPSRDHLPGALPRATAGLGGRGGRGGRWSGLMAVIEHARSKRAEQKLGGDVRPALWLDLESDPEMARFVAEQAPLVRFLARLGAVEVGPAPAGSLRDRVAGIDLALVVPRQERQEMGEDDRRALERDLAKVDAEIASAEPGSPTSTSSPRRRSTSSTARGGASRSCEERRQALLSGLGAEAERRSIGAGHPG